MKKVLIVLFLLIYIMPGYLYGYESSFHEGKTLFKKGNYKEAVKQFAKAVEKEKLIADYAHYYKACSYFQLGQYKEAIDVFNHLLTSYPKTLLRKKVSFRKKWARYKYYGFNKITTQELISLIEGFIGEYKNIEAKEILDEIMAKRRNDENYITVLYIAANVYYRIEGENGRNKILDEILSMEGKNAQILFKMEEYKEVYEKYPGSGYASHALRKIAIAAYINGNIKQAYQYFRALRFNYGGENSATALYWMAKCLDRLGNKSEAISYFKKYRNNYPDTYYGYRCAGRLGIYLGPVSSSGKGFFTVYNSKYWYLVKIGEYDDAGIEVSRAKIRVNYPYIYKEAIKKYAGQYNIDPLFMAALYYGESMFHAQIVSPVGAIGLGQIMPFTGDALAKELKINNYETEDLFKPEVNIRFSCYYVYQLLKDFGNKKVLVLCNYNAGPEAAMRWYERGKNIEDIDAFIENIGYRETRNYVKKVIKNYWMYQRIYGSYSHKKALEGLFFPPVSGLINIKL